MNFELEHGSRSINSSREQPGGQEFHVHLLVSSFLSQMGKELLLKMANTGKESVSCSGTAALGMTSASQTSAGQSRQQFHLLICS